MTARIKLLFSLLAALLLATAAVPAFADANTSAGTTPAGATSAAATTFAHPLFVAGHAAPGAHPALVPSGYGPADLQSAYKLPSSTRGAGQTVAIVDAYNDPTAEADLAVYRSTYGLPACTTANGCFRKVNQSGQASPLPRTDTGWAGEISLDVDMVSAICPNCNILLVEANNPNTGNLGTAVNTAVNLGAKFVSNSYGGPEDGSENSDDSLYFNHPGVVITASTGDNGFGVSYPASGKGVTAVGGTSLTRDTSTRGWSETVWNGAGSGCSGSVAKPAFQVGLNTGCGKRAEADVAAVADPQTGVAVYQTFGASGWAVYGGTSAASPIIASVYALAGNPGATDSPNSYPYAHTTALNDVTTGSNGNCGAPLCTAGVGYDGPTGLGTPQGTVAFSRLAASSTALASSVNPSTFGQPVTFTATVTSQAGTPTGSVSFSSDGNPLGTVTLTGATATFSTSGLSLGDHTISAAYAGDANFLTSSATLTQTTVPLEGLADPALSPVMNALFGVLKDSNGNNIIGLDPPCAMTGPYQGLSDIDKLSQSTQANDGCLQFVTTYDSPVTTP